MSSNASLLIADDEDSFAQLLGERLSRLGFQVTVVNNGSQALDTLEKREFDLALLDQLLPDCSGLEVLQRAKEIDPHIEVVMLTGYGTIENAIGAVRSGAYDYLTKPCSTAKLELVLRKALEKRELAEQAAGLSEALRRQSGSQPIIGRSQAMLVVKELIDRVADSDASVLILGESGTGKELVARSLHFLSQRRNRPFQALNSAALPAQLLETELFGYEKGAFTGAATTKKGLVEAADGGTLFLDEIADMDQAVQAKFLRFLENGEYIRLGSTRVRQVKVRVVAATNRDLRTEVSLGRFREDLYYRLNVVTINVPALRERKEDIPLLAMYLLKKRTGPNRNKEFTPAALKALQDYDFPGNVRELANMIERATLLANGSRFEPEHLFCCGSGLSYPLKVSGTPDGKRSLSDVEEEHIKKVWALTDGDKIQAARILGIGLRTLYRKLKDYGLQP